MVTPVQPPASEFTQPIPNAAARFKTTEMGILGTLLALYVLMHTVPIAEVINIYTGIDLKLAVITGVLVTAGAAFSGHILRFLQAPGAKLWVILLVLFFVATPFSVYRRESAMFVLEYAVRFHVFPFLICAIAMKTRDVGKIINWAGVATIILVALCLRFGEIVDGRLIVPGASLANPNDLGFWLLISSAYMMSWMLVGSRTRRVIALLTFPAAMYYILKTGSRGDFVILILAILVCLAIAPRRVKLVGGTLVAAGSLVLAALLPASVWTRMSTITLDARQELRLHPELAAELGSQVARIELQERAIQLIWENPLFGVGPVEFVNAMEEMVQRQTGRKSTWQSAHNVYLQIAAENGIPAGIVYVICILICLRTNYRIYRNKQWVYHARMQAMTLFMASIVFAGGVFFVNFAYESFLPILIGLTAANYLALRDEYPPRAPVRAPA